jgi:hypothetical protein
LAVQYGMGAESLARRLDETPARGSPRRSETLGGVFGAACGLTPLC